MKGKGERDLPAPGLVLDRGIELTEKTDLAFVPEAHHVARSQALGRPHERAPARAVETLVQRCLNGGLHDATADTPPA